MKWYYYLVLLLIVVIAVMAALAVAYEQYGFCNRSAVNGRGIHDTGGYVCLLKCRFID